jgi:hypothetical protein
MLIDDLDENDGHVKPPCPLGSPQTIHFCLSIVCVNSVLGAIDALINSIASLCIPD